MKTIFEIISRVSACASILRHGVRYFVYDKTSDNNSPMRRKRQAAYILSTTCRASEGDCIDCVDSMTELFDRGHDVKSLLGEFLALARAKQKSKDLRSHGASS